MIKYIAKFMNREDGATAIEYGLIAALVAVAIIGALTALGVELGDLFGGVTEELEDATPD